MMTKRNHEMQYAVRIIHCPLSSLLCVQRNKKNAKKINKKKKNIIYVKKPFIYLIAIAFQRITTHFQPQSPAL